MLSGMVLVELLESPQHDWWVVADGRVVGLYLKTDECPEPYRAAAAHGKELRRPAARSPSISEPPGGRWLSITLRTSAASAAPAVASFRAEMAMTPEQDEVEDAA